MLEKFITLMLIGRDEEKGATATEYALLVAFIAFAVIAGVTLFGTALSGYFSGLATTVGGWAGN